jgi:hypothetical protein
MAKPLRFKDFVSVDYTQSGDDQLAKQSKKRKLDIPTGNTGEALDFAARRKLARSLKKNKAKIAMGRKRAARKFADMDKLKKRAQKQARTMFFKKLTKGADKGKLSFARRQEIEKRLDKMRPKIDKVARKLLPKVRKMEKDRKRGGQNKDD